MTAPSDTPLLRLDRATLRFGGLTAVNALSLDLRAGELVGLIGPNGAGKTTAFNLVTGVYRPTEGAVLFEGNRLDRRRPHEIAALGVARTFQNIRLFGSLSVFDNVRAAFNLHRRTSVLAGVFQSRAHRREEGEIAGRIDDLLRLFHLERFRDEPAGRLPYGDQRRLEIVRCLAAEPKLLLLDEPAAGMNPAEKEELMRLIRLIRERHRLTLLLVEHSMRVVMGVCDRIAVLDHGVKIAEGSPAEIRSHPKVIEAYLGDEGGAALA